MFKRIFAVTIMLAIALAFAMPAFTADIMLDKKIQQITFKKDKNGNDYARIIIADDRTLNGVDYKKDTVVIAFSDVIQSVKGLKKGQNLKAIVSESMFRGGKSYQLLSIIK